MPMQPSPRAETAGPCRPSVRLSIRLVLQVGFKTKPEVESEMTYFNICHSIFTTAMPETSSSPSRPPLLSPLTIQAIFEYVHVLFKDQSSSPMIQQDPSARAAATPETLANRGRLRNVNPSRDYMTAPRCGATTRHGT